jgi:hypothetical protein
VALIRRPLGRTRANGESSITHLGRGPFFSSLIPEGPCWRPGMEGEGARMGVG